MGAVVQPPNLAIVTELVQHGSLFKVNAGTVLGYVWIYLCISVSKLSRSTLLACLRICVEIKTN